MAFSASLAVRRPDSRWNPPPAAASAAGRLSHFRICFSADFPCHSRLPGSIFLRFLEKGRSNESAGRVRAD